MYFNEVMCDFYAISMAMMYYSDEPQFYVPYQILNQLIEMDTLLMKWRCKKYSCSCVHY